MSHSGGGEFSGNILSFCRALRAAGIPVGSSQLVTALRAVGCCGLSRRDDLYSALQATLVNDVAQLGAFRAAFDAVFSNRPMQGFAVEGEGTEAAVDDTGSSMRLAAAATIRIAAVPLSEGEAPATGRAGGGSSARELLAKKDFEAMTPAELDAATASMREMALPLPSIPARRFLADPAGRYPDLRRSIRIMMLRDGQLLTIARRRRRFRTPACVLLCDVSGSMSAYSRVFLHFAHAMTACQPSTIAFVFGTRLTEISTRLKNPDVDRALADVAAVALDIDGGTRIARSLAQFNRHWARRLALHERTVILLSDGLERDTASDLEFQAARLHRSCRRFVWLNPMLRYTEFEPKAFGIRSMLPHVDQFLPAHNLDSIAGLCVALDPSVKDRARGMP